MLEEAILALYANPGARRSMGQRARKLFERDYAIETILERYADHIERTAPATGGRAT